MKNWKTTLIGAFGGAFVAIQPLLQTGVVDWKQVGLGFVIALLGLVSKDFNKTGA